MSGLPVCVVEKAPPAGCEGGAVGGRWRVGGGGETVGAPPAGVATWVDSGSNVGVRLVASASVAGEDDNGAGGTRVGRNGDTGASAENSSVGGSCSTAGLGKSSFRLGEEMSPRMKPSLGESLLTPRPAVEEGSSGGVAKDGKEKFVRPGSSGPTERMTKVCSKGEAPVRGADLPVSVPAKACPQLLQKRAFGRFSVPHFGQNMMHYPYDPSPTQACSGCFVSLRHHSKQLTPRRQFTTMPAG